MRAKQEILQSILEDSNKPGALEAMPLVQSQILIEVMIDIRDILEGLLGFAATLYSDYKQQT